MPSKGGGEHQRSPYGANFGVRVLGRPFPRSRSAGKGRGPHHALHAVGQQQHDAVLPHPLGLSRADELVDDALGRVVEVTKLGLPEDQGVRTGYGKTQLKACRAGGREKTGQESAGGREGGCGGGEWDGREEGGGVAGEAVGRSQGGGPCRLGCSPRTPYSDSELLHTV